MMTTYLKENTPITPVTTKANLVVRSKTRSFDAKNEPSKLESVLTLVRDGVGSQGWSNIVDFRIGRYEKKIGTSNPSRTQLDILLADRDLENTDPETNLQKIITLRANGNVSINGPDASLAIAGKLGNWKIRQDSTNQSISIDIEENSHNNLIPIYSKNTIGGVTVTLKNSKNENLSMNNWIATCQVLNNVKDNDGKQGLLFISLQRNENSLEFSIREVASSYVLLTVCLATQF